MDTYFIRHTWKLNITDATREALIAEHRIAIHYPEFADGFHDEDNRSLVPDEHNRTGRNTLRRFVELGRAGGYICAEYHGLEGCLVGVVAPGTSVEYVDGLWRDIPDRVAILKTLKLERAHIVPTSAAAAILVARPRQGTFMKWPRAKRAIIRLVDDLTEDGTLDDLSADQQEVICAEFLRTGHAALLGLPTLVHLLCPIGRTMRDIDVLGLASDGQPLFAQITYSDASNVAWKRDRLRPYVGKGHCLLFANAPTISVERGVTIVPLALVFDQFAASIYGEHWLAAARGNPLVASDPESA